MDKMHMNHDMKHSEKAMTRMKAKKMGMMMSNKYHPDSKAKRDAIKRYRQRMSK